MAGNFTSIAGSGAGGAVADETLNQVHMYQEREHDRDLQKKDFENTKALNEQMSQLAQIARQSNMGDVVAGAQAAGISPLAAIGQSFSGPATSSAGSHGSSMRSERLLNSAGQLASLAQAGLLVSERKGQDIANKRMESEDNSVNSALNQFKLEIETREAQGKEVNPVDSALAHALDGLQMNEVLDAGTLQGMENYLNVYGLNYQVLADNMSNSLRAIVDKSLADDKDIPKAKINEVKRKATLLMSEITNLSANTTLLQSQKRLTDEQILHVRKQVKHLEQTIKSMQDSDDVWLWKNDRLGFWIKNATTAAHGALNAVAGGGAIGLASRMARGAERSVQSSVNRKDYRQSNHSKQSKYLPAKNTPRKYGDLSSIATEDMLDNAGGW